MAMVARTDAETAAVKAALAEGMLPLSFLANDARPDNVELVCRKPRTNSSGLRVRFGFDLGNPVHATELLLIARRREVCIDVLQESAESGDLADLGTLRVSLPPELRRFLVTTASAALTRRMPVDYRPDDEEVGSQLPDALRSPLGGQHLDVGFLDRRGLIAATIENGDRIAVEAEYPPVTMTAAQTDPEAAIVLPAGRSRAERHQIGFVYVQRNPAFPDLLKIGHSTRLAEDRAAELYRTQLPFPFEVLHRVAVSHSPAVEKAVHRMLAAHRVNPGREFFRVDPHTAEQAIHHCWSLLMGIEMWEPMPGLHRLRAGDRLTLPLAAGQIFVITAFADGLLSNEAEIVDVWPAHADGDVLELYVTDDPGRTSGFSDNDPRSDEDPVPYLDRNRSVPNGVLIGRERLVAGDRLNWLVDRAGTCTSVLFEGDGFCQVTCRTRSPQYDDGMPLLLNVFNRSEPASMAMRAAVAEVLALGPPRTWAPRHPDPEHWAPPATRATEPDYWLPQLRPRQHNRRT
jgi:hypothetical protein